MTHRSSICLAIALGGALASCSTGRVSRDLITESAVADNDATALVQGCGNPPAVGIAYCRMVEGKSTDELLTFIGPPAKCKREHCLFLKVWDNQSNLVFGAPFAPGETQLAVPWAVLLNQVSNVKKPASVVGPDAGNSPVTKVDQSKAESPPQANVSHTFERAQRGFWSWNLQVYWIDEQGFERQSQAQGDIVLRVYKKGYVPLAGVSEDSNYVWWWQAKIKDDVYDFKSTSSLRSYVGKAD